VRWCEARLRENAGKKSNVTLTQYAQGFWAADAPFAVDRAAHGRAVSLGHLELSEGYTRNHLLPKGWGVMQLQQLTTKAIDARVVELHRNSPRGPSITSVPLNNPHPGSHQRKAIRKPSRSREIGTGTPSTSRHPHYAGSGPSVFLLL